MLLAPDFGGAVGDVGRVEVGGRCHKGGLDGGQGGVVKGKIMECRIESGETFGEKGAGLLGALPRSTEVRRIGRCGVHVGNRCRAWCWGNWEGLPLGDVGKFPTLLGIPLEQTAPGAGFANMPAAIAEGLRGELALHTTTTATGRSAHQAISNNSRSRSCAWLIAFMAAPLSNVRSG